MQRPVAPAPVDTEDAGRRARRLAIAGMIAAAAVGYLYRISAYGLLDNNEGLYAEIAREMLDSRQWIIPQLNGVPYLEKPPLLFWLVALAYSVLGAGEAGARLVSAASAMGTALLTVVWVRRNASATAGWLCGLVLLTTLGWAAMGRVVMFDMLLTFWLVAALMLIEIAREPATARSSAAEPPPPATPVVGVSSRGSDVQATSSGRVAEQSSTPGTDTWRASGSGLAALEVSPRQEFNQKAAALMSWSKSPALWPSALAGVALAGGVMTKGLLALVLPVLVVLAHVALTRDRASLKRIRYVPMTVLFLLVAVPWHVLAALRQSEFVWFYFINEHVLRFLDLRTPRDYYTGPFWYYIPRLALFTLPWTFLLPGAFAAGWSGLRGSRSASAQDSGGPGVVPRETAGRLAGYCFVWFAAAFLFFTISRAKANYYVLPALPPLAVLVALVLDRWVKDRESIARPRLIGIPAGIQLVAVAAVLPAAAIVAGRRFFPGGAQSAQNGFLPGGEARVAVAAAVGGAALYAAGVLYGRLRRPLAVVTGCCALFLVTIVAVLMVLPSVDNEFSSRTLAGVVLRHRAADEPVVVQGRIDRVSSLPFYLRLPLVECDGRMGDLEWSKRWGYGGRTFTSSDRLTEWARAHPSWIHVGRPKDAKRLRAILPDATVEVLDTLPRNHKIDRVVYRVKTAS